MPYTVISQTSSEAAAGGSMLMVRLYEKLLHQLTLVSKAQAREICNVKIHFLDCVTGPESFEEQKRRFGGEPLTFYFLNDCAVRAFAYFGMKIRPIGTVEELPVGVGGAVDHPL